MSGIRSSGNNIIAWDSVVFISLFKGGQKYQQRMGAILPVLLDIQKGRCRLIVSALVYTEILDYDMPKSAMKQFLNFINDPRLVNVIPVDTAIARAAHDIRNQLKIRNCSNPHPNPPPVMKTPDAIILATAIIHKAWRLHTFDQKMLNLDNAPEAAGVRITPCTP